MKVLHIVSDLGKNSGVVSVIMNLYRNLDSDVQFDFLLHSHADPSYEDEVTNGGSEIYIIPKPSLTTAVRYKKDLFAFFDKYGKNYDIVHCHELVLSKLYGKAAHKAGCKYVLHSHSTKFSERLLRSIRNRILFVGAKSYCDYFFACSYIAGKAMFGRCADKSNFSVLVNGIDAEQFTFDEEKRKTIRTSYAIADDAVVLGSAGRLARSKNGRFAIEVFKAYNAAHRNSYLMFIGDGPERQALQALAKQDQLEDRVLFAGVQSDVAGYLSALDYFLFPSKFEGLGLAVVEAQASGLRCAVSVNVPEEACVRRGGAFYGYRRARVHSGPMQSNRQIQSVA